MYYLGDISLTQDKPAEAAELFAAAITRNPSCPDAHIGLGKAFFRMNKNADALRQFERANQIDARQADVHYWLATVYRRLQDVEKSQREMQRFQALTEAAKASPTAEPSGHDRWASSTCMDGLQVRRRNP